MRYIIIALLIFISSCSFAQNKITGVVLDSNTNKAVPFVNIYSPAQKVGTSTNEAGEFVIPLQESNSKLVFSHVNFEEKAVRPNEFKDTIFLNPAAVVLPEVSIGSEWEKEIIRKAYNRTKANSNYKNYVKAFYRQVTTQNEKPTEIFESFHILEANNSGVQRDRLVQGRYGRAKVHKKEVLFTYTNFSYFSFNGKILQDTVKNNSIILPVSSRSTDFYRFQLLSIIEHNNFQIAEIQCKPNKELAQPAFEGLVYINLENYNVIRQIGTIKHHLGVVSNSRKYRLSNHSYFLDFKFEADQEGKPVLQRIRVNAMLDLKPRRKAVEKVEVNSLLMIYETDVEVNQEALTNSGIETNDFRKIKEAKYNPQFWEDNPVVKRTPVEEKIINSLEERSLIGNYQN